MKPVFKLIAITVLSLIAVAIFAGLLIDCYVRNVGAKHIVSEHDVPKADAILILGAYVYPDGTVSWMLNDRLTVGLELYQKNKAAKLLVSGDHGKANYDEANAMKRFLMNKGVPSQDVFMDHAGFSTYESIFRARDVFKVKKVIIVTQQYHLMRAVYIANQLGLEAYGVASDRRDYGLVMINYQLREIAARDKDFFTATIVKPKPTFLGQAMPVTGDGRITDDK